MVYDGMCGDYCFAGKIISKLDEYGDSVVNKIPLKKMDIKSKKLASVLSKAFWYIIYPKDISLILFSPYH